MASFSDPSCILRAYYAMMTTTLRDWFDSEMLLDTLTTQPTPELAVMMLQLVQTGELGGLRASLMINAMSLVVKPTPAVILTALVRAA